MNRPVPKNQTWIQAEQKKEKQSKLSKEELAFRSRFDNMKYQLRKQFRIQDESRNGLLDEEAFVNAISITDQSITDDDLFAFTTKFFPYAGHLIDYNDLMEQIFD
jgi:Ca2+-binding EF-hand superfamily protein